MEHLREIDLIPFRGLVICLSLSCCFGLWCIGGSFPDMLAASQNGVFLPFFGIQPFHQ